MLGKFIRQEMKAQEKIMAAVYGALAVATVLMFVFFEIQKFAVNAFSEGVYFISCSIYMLTIVVSAVVSFIYLCYRFYQSMYSAQGYLTHTLPLKPAEILNAKIFVSFVFLFLTVVFCTVSFVVLGSMNDGLSIGELADLISQALRETEKELGISGVPFVFLMLFLVMTVCLYSLLMFFAGSSIGQLASRSKGICGIAAGIGLYYLSEIISVIVVAAAYFLFFNIRDVLKPVWFVAGAIIILLFWTVLYYAICRKIVTKHLNLE